MPALKNRLIALLHIVPCNVYRVMGIVSTWQSDERLPQIPTGSR